MLYGDAVEKFAYLVNRVSAVDAVTDEVNLHMAKPKVALTYPVHLRRLS